MNTDSAPPCLDCGCCCFSNLSDYVRVTGDDYKRLGEQAETFVAFDGHRAHMRMHEGHCAALQLVFVGTANPTLTPESETQAAQSSGVAQSFGTAQYRCQVYEQRPQTCRDLERGSGECRAERHEKSERPAAARLIQLRHP